MDTKDILTIIQNNSHSNGGLIAILEGSRKLTPIFPKER